MGRSDLIPLLFALFAMGFTFMAMEILFLRELLITLGGTIYASSATFAAVMLGLFLGSQIFGCLSSKVKSAAFVLALSALALGGLSLFLIPALRWCGLIESWFSRYALSFLLILIPSIAAGGPLPLAVETTGAVSEKNRPGFRAGLFYGAGTLGALVAALALPFAALPHLGSYRSSLLAGLASLAGGLILLRHLGRVRRALVILGLAAACLFVFIGFSKAGAWLDRLSAVRAMGSRDPALGSRSRHYLEDSPYQRIQIIGDLARPEASGKIRTLYLDGIAQSSVPRQPQYREWVYFALLPHPHPENVLVIGCGDGDFIVSILADRRVKRIDQVEIDPATVKVSRRFLMDLNYFRGKNVWENSKTKLHINDGRVFVRRTQAQYDLIVANLPDTRREGASVFYSLEFMKLVRSRLSPEGIFITHLWRSAGPGYGRQEEAAAMLIITATAKAVFGGNTYLLSPRLWPKKVKPYDWGAPPLLMASNGPLDLDNAAIEKRFQNFEPKPAWMTPERCLRWLENSYLPPGLDGFPISTDDRPAILYASLWKRRPAVSAILRLDD